MGLAPFIGLDLGLRGLDLGLQAGRQGGGGSQGYQWDPSTTSFLAQALAGGQPVSDVMRTPGQGQFKYALSKLGILSPQVHANADQMALEQLALKQQATEQAGQFGDIFSQAARIASIDPSLAQQFYGREQKQIPSLGAIDPNTFKNIFTRAQLAQQAELLRQRHELWAEQHGQTMEEQGNRRLDIEAQRAQQSEAREAATESRSEASAARQEKSLDLMQQRLDQQSRLANQAQSLTFLKDILTSASNSGNPVLQKWAQSNLAALAGRYGMLPPPSGPTTTPSTSRSIPGFGPAPAPSAGRPAATIPW